MLRITTFEDAGTSTMKLEGKIAGPWVAEFAHTWQSLAASLGPRKLRLDLRSVSFVDPAGQQLLREIYRQTHAEFLADSPLVAYFVEQATNGSSQHAGEGD
jgi:anti-anti-sigma regulatory factor